MKDETVEDIIREMRGMREFYGAEWCALADRIDSAWHRDINKRAIVAAAMADAENDTIEAKCHTCKFYERAHHHCSASNSLTNPNYGPFPCWRSKKEAK